MFLKVCYYNFIDKALLEEHLPRVTWVFYFLGVYTVIPRLQVPEAIYYAPTQQVKKPRNYTRSIIIGWLVALLISLIALSGYNVSAPAAASKNTPPVTTSTVDAFYAVKVNELRAKNGLAPVRLLIELNQSSANKANNMASKHYWAHEDPDGTQFSDYIWKTVPSAQIVGENLARCYMTRDAAFEALVNSPTHYAIMVGNFNYMGVSEAYDIDMGCTVTAMHFARI
jgi:uncharacterized protein YkwD